MDRLLGYKEFMIEQTENYEIALTEAIEKGKPFPLLEEWLQSKWEDELSYRIDTVRYQERNDAMDDYCFS